MKILVLVKRVPDTAASIRITGEGASIAQDVEWVMSPYDEMAVEEAVRIKERTGAEVVAVSLAPEGAVSHIRLALEMGADRAVHLVDSQPDRDAWSTAKALAEVVKEEAPDLVLAGRTAVDMDQSFVAPAVAALLGLPFLSSAVKLDLEGGKAVIRHEIEGGHEVLEAPLPCVVTTQKGINEPRYPSLKSKIKAKKKKVDTRPAPEFEALVKLEALSYPPQRQAGRILGEGVEAVPELVRVLSEEVKII